jgi:formylglycine-generating enzyme
MNMKRILFLSLIVALLSSCGVGTDKNYQELTGSQDRVNWNPTIPFGMVFVPQGSFVMGPSDQDVPFANVTTNQRVSVGAFFMDETEITNNEYRQFVEWVQDSIIRHKMSKFSEEEGVFGKANGKIRVTKRKDTSKSDSIIDWDKNNKIEKEKDANGINVYNKIYDTTFVKAWVDGKEVIKKTAYKYKYEQINYRKLSDARVKDISIDTLGYKSFRLQYVDTIEIVIYPNTTDFQGDYVYSHEETESEFNFLHEAYDDYPVIGITWHQANAFCHWRTHIMNQYLKKEGEPLLADYRLPTETEWEYAARGGLSTSPYPWGGPYTRNMRGCFLANFKPLRGNFSADGGHKAITVQSYNPNNYGLYDMSGNVAEWTSTAFDETSSSYTGDMDGDNSNLGGIFDIQAETDEQKIQRKVIRGGSWKDIAYYIQTSTRDYEYADESTSYIGFRCVMDFLGRDMKDFKKN